MKRSAFAVLSIGLALALGQVLPTAADGWSGLEGSIQPDRPDFTEGTGLIPPGHIQVEGGTTLARVEDTDSTSLGELLVRIGIGERSEARIGLGSYTWVDDGFADVSGFEDPALELKVRLTDEAAEQPPGRPAVALVLGTSVPAGDKNLTSDAWVPLALVSFDWVLGPRSGLGANLGGSYAAGDGGDRFNQAFASLSAGFSVTDRLGTYLEWYGFSREEIGGPSTHYVDGGVSFLINDDLIVDARVGTGLNDAHPDWFAGVGASVRW
jgi:hypothetical protein